MRTQLLLFAIFLFSNGLYSQSLRYFEVVTDLLPGGDWRDTTYVVAASDTALLAQIDYELSLPIASRRHINSPLAAGDGGFNHNAGYWYSWHSKPNEWEFAEISAEVCDGRSYSDVGSDTAYWINVVGRYCGWSYHIAREISAPVSVPEPPINQVNFLPIVPNPVNDEVLFSWTQSATARATLMVVDELAHLSVTLPLGRLEAGAHEKPFNTASLSSGVYFATMQVGAMVLTQRFVVVH